MDWWKRNRKVDGLLPRTIAFVDLLGFRETTRKMSKDEGTFSRMTSVAKAIRGEAEAIYGGLPSELSVAAGDVEMTTFSDCWVLSALDQNAHSVLLHTRTLAARLLSQGVLVRGAITSGALCHHGGIVMGEAMVAAYELETRVAVYPRILVHDEIVRRFEELAAKRVLRVEGLYCRRDADGCFYLDIFSPPHPPGGGDGDDEFLRTARRHISEGLRTSLAARNLGIVAKWRWMAGRFNQSIRDQARTDLSPIDFDRV